MGKKLLDYFISAFVLQFGLSVFLPFGLMPDFFIFFIDLLFVVMDMIHDWNYK